MLDGGHSASRPSSATALSIDSLPFSLSQIRQEIIGHLYLSKTPLRKYQIAKLAAKDDQTIDYHLKALKGMNLVVDVQQDGFTTYRLSDLGKAIAQAYYQVRANPYNVIDIRARELAVMLNVPVDTPEFARMRKAMQDWFEEDYKSQLESRKKELQERNGGEENG
jgi:DNA-binding transcriptional ArsR family regulator